MSLLNHTEYSSTNIIHELRNWNDADYFLVEFFLGSTFDSCPIDSRVPDDILQKIKNDENTYLYLFNTYEAFLTIVEPLYQHLVIKNKIPPKKIYIGTNSPDLDKEIKVYADENNLEYMKIEWITQFECSAKRQLKYLKKFGIELDGSTMLLDKNYDKKYLNFNRKWRIQRPILVALLKAKKILHKGHVSLAVIDEKNDWENIWNKMISTLSSDKELTDLFLEHESEIKNIPNLYLDTEDLVTNKAALEPSNLYLYENSLVSLVTETYFFQNVYTKRYKHVFRDEDSRFLSEKIFKPIIFGHPFIYVAPPNSLELIRSLGYKTFHPYIDESYDLEVNDLARLKKIIREIEIISNFTDEEVKEFCNNVKEICDFNQNLIKSHHDTYARRIL